MLKNNSINSNNTLINYQYLYDTKDRKNLEFYFSMKNKYGFVFDEKKFELIKNDLKCLHKKYDLVIYPETSNLYLDGIAQYLSDSVICLQKNSLDFIKESLFSQTMNKNETKSFINCLNDMNCSFQMNKIKSNQRKRFVNFLFKKIEIPKSKKRILVLDDSIFGGYTFISMLNSIANINDFECDKIVLFSK